MALFQPNKKSNERNKGITEPEMLAFPGTTLLNKSAKRRPACRPPTTFDILVVNRKVCRKPGSVLPVVQAGTTTPPTIEVTIIYLGLPLLTGSSDQPERTSGQGCGTNPPRSSLVLLQMGFTREYVTIPPRGLLHHGSTLACAGMTPAIGGPFLWHYPSARADWTLSSILPYGARTFLPC
jgi:hypothetical protein